MQLITEFFFDWMFSITSQEGFSKLLASLITGGIIFVSAFILFIICRKILFTIAHRIASKTESTWDDIIIKNKTINGLAHLIPATLIYFSANYAGLFYPKLAIYILKLDEIYYLVIFVFTLNAFLTSLNEIYNQSFSFSKERPITGIVQLVKIFIFFAGFLFLISILFNKEIAKLLTGLGAAAAILLLVFKDAILGFVASMQISMNDMVKVGDWIEMPSRNADGEVLEINLTTVKVQNWDLTISMIPTYSLISETFVNWKGMQLADGRRIKRSINLDMTSIVFCDQTMLEKFSNYPLINTYIDQIISETKKTDSFSFDKKVTNLSVYRKYIEFYLETNPFINKEMTCIVRHLQSNNYGLPIELIVFSKDKTWEKYEEVQADLFDHILAIIPEFDLRIYQSPMTTYLPRQ